MVNYHALALLALDAVVLGYLIVAPLSRHYDDSDRGSGAVVDLPPFGRPSLPRVGSFLAVGVAVGAVIAALHHPGVSQLYRGALMRLLHWLVNDPAAVSAYAGHIVPLVPAAFVGYLVTAAFVLPATWGRRLMILAHAPLFVATSLVTDGVLGMLTTAGHVVLWPPALVSMFLQYLVGYMTVLRLFFTSNRLPRLTPVPRLRRGDWPDNVVLVCCLLGAAGLVFCVATILYRTSGSDPVVGFVVGIPVQFATIDVLAILLIMVGRAEQRLPQPGPHRPPLEVIIPAYNESVVIERMLWSIDRAAGNYGGPVKVIMVDDGSTDDTKDLAEAVMASYRHATGVVLEGKHGGKSKALNLALSHCEAEFVYRLDADCAIDPNAFVYSIADFLADPRVGLVGAMHMPKEPYGTWLDRMRAFELFYSFGFLRVAQSQVDMVPCIPGSFCAFRRTAGLAIGGFVHGMMGEDTDFSCGIARLGYRAFIDTRVISYEDVPTTVKQLRVQRFRWGIGGRLVYTRFVPFNRDVGAPGPRFWFQMTKGAASHMLAPAHAFLWLLSLQYALTQPSPHHNIARWLGVLVLAQALALVPKFLVLAYYRRLRLLPWAVLWVPYELLKRFFLLEALLAFGMRPVKPPMPIRGVLPEWGALFRPRRAVQEADA
ncbi:MAG TPA: glycosyltransferase [Streptosporangiaceae bacterium]|nr:glycosyltransferase [Streptosporangiaceae bacterium]